MKLDFKDKAHAKVGSLDNASHMPGGGNVMVTKLSIHSVKNLSVRLKYLLNRTMNAGNKWSEMGRVERGEMR